MSENPDRKNETMTDFLPVQGMLRYVVIPGIIAGTGETILQQYQYSATDAKTDWYDVPSVDYVAVEEQEHNPQQDKSDAFQVNA